MILLAHSFLSALPLAHYNLQKHMATERQAFAVGPIKNIFTYLISI